MAKIGQYILKKTGQGLREKLAQEGEAIAKGAAEKGDRLAAPAVQTQGHAPAAEKVFQYAEANPARYEMATEPVFAPADPELTKRLVPQESIAHLLPPQNLDLAAQIEGGRSIPIHQNREELGRLLAQTIRDNPDANLPFYSTGTVLQGLVDQGGMSPEEAFTFVRDWAGQGAGTSPRTRTPPNLRNSSYLTYRRAIGDPLTPEQQLAEQKDVLWGVDKKGKALLNRQGFPMMQMHTSLADEFAKGTADPLKNPKPYTFRENWSGNMADVTADTHNIRAILDAYDQMFPGTLQKEWFDTPEDYANYREAKGFPATGSLEKQGIADTLGNKTIKGRKIQFEYPIMQGPTIEAAKNLDISPAEAQERLWFAKGPRTGLASPPMTIPDLLNSQFEVTAKVLGISPLEVMRLWKQRAIPLAQNDESQPVPGQTEVG